MTATRQASGIYPHAGGTRPDLLKAMHHQEDHQCQMNDAEIMTTACIAALFFRGNHESARAMLQQHGYVTHMVS
jgi:hypothetical protein